MKDDIKPLTGIRGVAVFLVMLYHFGEYGNGTFSCPGFPALNKAYLCVDLFFVLSGFVLALRYGERFKLGNTSRATYTGFLKVRIARVYPAYIVITVLYFAKYVSNFSGHNTHPYGLTDIVANVLLLQSWGLPARCIISDSWSISVELLAYISFPLLVLLALGRSVAISVALVGASFAGLLFIALSGHGTSGALDVAEDTYLVLLPLRCVAEFSLGLVAFRLASSPSSQRWLSNEYAIGVVLLLLSVSVCVNSADVITVGVIALLTCCLYHNSKTSQALFGNTVIHHLGNISYSFYLLHPLFIGVAGHYEDLAAAHSYPAPCAFLAIGALATWGAS